MKPVQVCTALPRDQIFFGKRSIFWNGREYRLTEQESRIFRGLLMSGTSHSYINNEFFDLGKATFYVYVHRLRLFLLVSDLPFVIHTSSLGAYAEYTGAPRG